MLFRSNAIAAGYTASTGANLLTAINFTYTMTSGTTSATTFKFRAGGEGGTSGNTTYFNGISGARKMGGVMASSIVIKEIGG